MSVASSQGTARRCARADVLMRRTYNRPLNDAGTIFETWHQTRTRVMSHQRWLWETELGGSLNVAMETELAELEQCIDYRQVAPAGRTMWLGGTEIVKRRQASQFNPGRRTTKFITRNGVMSFEDFEDGDDVIVLTHTGAWQKATVAKAGTQPVNRITFSRGRSQQVEYFTPTHTWLLADGTRTQNLQTGDRIHVAPSGFYDWNYDDAPLDEKLQWAYGLVYGDGAIAKSGGSLTSRVRLCGKKAEYLSRFQELGFEYSFPPSCDDDPFVYTGKYLKTLPHASDPIRLLRAFVRGYLDADGAVNSNSTAASGERYSSIQSTDPEAQQFIEAVFPMVGLYVISKKAAADKTNYGKRTHTTYSYHLRSDLSGRANINGYTVTAIEPLGHEEVWCLTVDEDHSFVLPNGVVTGNCSFLEVRTVHDMVDMFWLLLQGCGVGFKPVNGALSGFTRRMEVELIRSTRTEADGPTESKETYDQTTKTWTIQIGDSAEAWAKSIGKIVAGKFPARKLVIDFSPIRPAGKRLKGYGWICNGDRALSVAYAAICAIMNRQAGKLLSKQDIWQMVNWLGTVLSNRRSAEVGLIEYGDKEWHTIATMKPPGFDDGPDWYLSQSNNTLLFYEKPRKKQIADLFDMLVEHGGSEPGIANAAAALRRAPWFKGFNPCVEILLADKGFCNLCELDVAKFRNDERGMQRALHLIARANYRQTCVNLRDGVLQDAWHQNNEYLRLCGVGLTGIARRPDLTPYDYRQLKYIAVAAAYGMADELDRERPKNVTCVKPSGTLSKAHFDTTEGAHVPDARFIINSAGFNRREPIVNQLLEAGYWLYDHPSDPDSILAALPVGYPDVAMASCDGQDVNMETAVEQLERYKMLQRNWSDQNTSITVSFEPHEKKSMVEWFDRNWDDYVACSFTLRNKIEAGKNIRDVESFKDYMSAVAKKRGFAYMPQIPITKEDYERYTANLKDIDIDAQVEGTIVEPVEPECLNGSCPTR